MRTSPGMLAPVAATPTQLRRALRRIGLSQRQLAHRLAVDVGTVNRWATGRAPIPESVRLLLECWHREQRRQETRTSRRASRRR